MKFQYVNIVTKGCESWLNLFIGEYVLCMVDNVHLANLVRAEIDAQEHLDAVDAKNPCEECGEWASYNDYTFCPMCGRKLRATD